MIRYSKRRLAYSVLAHHFTSPENQKRNWSTQDQAVFSAATLLAAQIRVSFKTAADLVRAWYEVK